MFRIIFNRLWYERRNNAWIFFELMFAGLLLWVVLDPLCVFLGTLVMDSGRDTQELYLVDIRKYSDKQLEFNAEIENDSLNCEYYKQIVNQIVSMPEIDCYAVTGSQNYPNSRGVMGTFLYRDSTDVMSGKYILGIRYVFYQEGKGDMLRTYGLKDARTGEVLSVDTNAGVNGQIYVSEDMAKAISVDESVQGKEVWVNNGSTLYQAEIAGVFASYKFRDYDQPEYMVVYVKPNLEPTTEMNNYYNLIVKLKSSADKADFMRNFENNAARAGNYYCKGLIAMDKISDDFGEVSGVFNVIRRNILLASFGLLCVLLGTIGTFWVKAKNRRQEIGVMRSIGASTTQISAQFVTETMMLVSIAFVMVLLLMGYYVYNNGFFAQPLGGMTIRNYNPEYWQNNPLKHYAVISAITWLVITATALVGTIVPVLKVSQELPADALRDE